MVFGLLVGPPAFRTFLSIDTIDELRSATAEIDRIEVRRSRWGGDVVITTTNGKKLVLNCHRVCGQRGSVAVAEIARSSETITYWAPPSDDVGNGGFLYVIGFEMGGFSVDPAVGLRKTKFDEGGLAIMSLLLGIWGGAMTLGYGIKADDGRLRQ